jgi:HSP20 family protein
MLMRTDPFRGLDRLTGQLLGDTAGTWSRPIPVPMDAHRDGETFVACFDLPGITPDPIELNVERKVLTVKAERRPVPLHGRRRADARSQPGSIPARATHPNAPSGCI